MYFNLNVDQRTLIQKLFNIRQHSLIMTWGVGYLAAIKSDPPGRQTSCV